MIRRHLLMFLAASLMSLPHHVLAQRATKTPKVGVLITYGPSNDPVFDSLRDGLHDLGYQEGRDISLKFVSAGGQLERLPGIARDLLDESVDIIVSTNEVSTRAAQKATAKIPIVMVGYGYDPVSLGLIDNVRRPGGNTTGTYTSTPDLEKKRLEIFRRAIPEVSYVAILGHSPFGESAVGDLQRCMCGSSLSSYIAPTT